MPKVLILVAHRPNRSPSQRYRFEQYLPFLESKGFSFTWSYLISEKEDAVFYSTGNTFKKMQILLKSVLIRIGDLKKFQTHDIIFIQREALFFGSSYFERKAKQSGKKVIFDFDDAIWLPDTSPGNKKWAWLKKPEKFKENVANASVVIAGNNYLANEAIKYNKNVEIIPTTINTDFHKPKPELRGKDKIVIGWSGSISTIKHFESIVPVLLQLKKKYNGKIAFKVFGDGNYFNADLNIKGKAWQSDEEVNELNSFDIGIMPLPFDGWTNGKCGLKALSYMACGVPTILSAVGVNTTIVENGKSGLLVSSEPEWYNALEKLIDDVVLRKQIGEGGRKRVVENYSVNVWEESYLKVFNL